jgi:hypothetical protein
MLPALGSGANEYQEICQVAIRNPQGWAAVHFLIFINFIVLDVTNLMVRANNTRPRCPIIPARRGPGCLVRSNAEIR